MTSFMTNWIAAAVVAVSRRVIATPALVMFAVSAPKAAAFFQLEVIVIDHLSFFVRLTR